MKLSFIGVAALVGVVVVLSPGAVEAKPQGLISFKDVLAHSLYSAAKTPGGSLGEIWSDCSKTWIHSFIQNVCRDFNEIHRRFCYTHWGEKFLLWLWSLDNKIARIPGCLPLSFPDLTF